MVDLDEVLSVIENPARRKILEALVREPHYPLQLSKELGMSQQAVMKHLKVLENYHLVESYKEPSNLGGPMRNKYYPALNFTIIVDLGPNLFNAEMVSRECESRDLQAEETEDLSLEKFDIQVKALRKSIARTDEELDRLQIKRDRLMDEKEKTMADVGRLMDRMQDYQIRKIMYEFISRPELDIKEIAKLLSIRDEIVARALRDLIKE